jgi:thiamine biosynthesis lipoprotein ApbE
MEADALTKVLFVQGLEEGLAQVRSVPRADALCVFKDGRTVSTDGFPRIS